jgi:pimeloyl-ACP methyl ester carboxylesterase
MVAAYTEPMQLQPRYFFQALVTLLALTALPAMAQTPVIGMVLMHGKGGSPNKHVNGLATQLEARGFRVANLEMPWSEAREYDADTDAADRQISEALAALKAKGANKLFVAGHSQGGTFGLHYASIQPVDGVIVIAPGGSTAYRGYQDRMMASIELAQKLIAEGKAAEKNRFNDYESSKGPYPVTTTATNYLSWFSADGAMNMTNSAKRLPPQTPVLWIVAKQDYPSLIRINLPFFQNFAGNPLSRLYQPDADHLGAPSASADEIIAWTEAAARATSR